MVYVLNIDGRPLMPTDRSGRVRRLLRKGHVVVVDYHPFTIQLTYDTPNGAQEVSLGVDAGTKHVGFSATTKKKVLFEAELLLRSDIVDKLSTRREFRRTRRSRKTRYRKSRFLNRVHGYRLMDSVVYAERPCFVNGRRQSGYFSISDISGKILAGATSYKYLYLIHHNNSNIMEDRVYASL